MSQNNKPQTWDELVESHAEQLAGQLANPVIRSMYPSKSRGEMYLLFRSLYFRAIDFSNANLSSHPRVVELLGVLERAEQQFKKASLDNINNPFLYSGYSYEAVKCKQALEKFNNGGIE